MPEYKYIARDFGGRQVAGSMAAQSEGDVLNWLAGQSLFPVRVAADQPRRTVGGRRVSGQAMAAFYGQLASLLRNGVPLMRSLHILREQTSAARLRGVLEDVAARVEDGTSLGDAFARHPKVFVEIATNMARAGTEGGFLEDALDRVAQFTEHQTDLRARTVGALVYPIILATIGTAVVSVLIIFFVPLFAEMFDQLRQQGELPAVTDWVLGLSDLIRRYGLIFVGLVAILLVAARVQLKTERGKHWRDLIKLRSPVFGPIFKSLAVARFCRVLGTLLHNGVPILKALEISRQSTGNVVLSQAVAEASENVTAGESLAGPLRKSGHFPPAVTEMISVAEESNTLDSVLINISDGLEKQTARRLELLVRLLEPAMLVVMAGVILIIVVALLLPVMKMGTALQ
jgi:general secretion pathway protein F/type IV pilus assembly protein PilC